MKPTVLHLWFCGLLLLSIGLFHGPLSDLKGLTLQNGPYAHVLLIPLISAALIYRARHEIFRETRPCPAIGLPLVAIGIVAYYRINAHWVVLRPADRLSLAVCALVLVWAAGFILCYGLRPFRNSIFPLAFLFFTVPLPAVLLEKAVAVLQAGSADLTYVIFRALGVPVLRHGLVFSLPGVEIEIAQQCSGIRSSMALFITSILAGHLVLTSAWRRALLGAASIPIVIFKNALRIVGISWLGIYVDPQFLYGRLHHEYGGLVFSLVAIGILVPLLFVLHRSERSIKRAPAHTS